MAQGQKTDPEVEEQIVAYYFTCQSYAKTGRKFGLAETTVFGMVKRLAGDRVAELRTSMRADLARDAMKQIRGLIRQADPKTAGIEGRTSKAADAARAAADLSRVLQFLDPTEKEAEAVIPTINVFTGVAPPAELAIAQDTTLPADGTGKGSLQ